MIIEIPKTILSEIMKSPGLKHLKNFVLILKKNGLPDIVCFDHDLGTEKSGYDCAKYLVNYCQQHNLDIPQYDIQSSNVVGKENIRSLMDNWHRLFISKS